VVNIIVFKPDLEINPGQGLGHVSRVWTRVDSSWCKNKNDYYHSFKPNSGVATGHR